MTVAEAEAAGAAARIIGSAGMSTTANATGMSCHMVQAISHLNIGIAIARGCTRTVTISGAGKRSSARFL